MRNFDLSDVKKLNLREMANLLSYALPFSLEHKFKLLRQGTLGDRIKLLIDLMDTTYKLIEFPTGFKNGTKNYN
ncbi:MAG: hypothetical protein ACW99Q_01625 [Candidatus Kariarchaeaceae archaeon]|jgi:Lon protease-like protein